MNNENKNNSSLPLVIIGLVLLAAIVGGWWLYQSSKSKTVKTNVNKPIGAPTPLVSSVAGAQPPNMLGSPNAAVTVEEFADFQCPTCASVHSKMKEINALYGSRIKFIFRNFPLPMHRHGYEAAVAAEAAGLQGKFWEMQNQLFTNQQSWANSTDARAIFNEYAQKIGLDVDKFQSDSLGLAAKGRVDLDLERARSLKVNATPTIFINGRPLSQEQFDVAPIRQVIDAELQKAQGGAGQTSSGQSNPETSSQTPAANQINNGGAKKEAGNSK